MLEVVDSMLAGASSNDAFDAKIPLLDVSIKEVIGLASVFTNALFEFFVMLQPFDDRKEKSLLIKG